MPSFTNNVIDQAYENFMKQIPGFHREPGEAKVIQKDIEDVVRMIFRNDAHGVLFEKEIRLHKGSAHSLAAPTKKFTAALFSCVSAKRVAC